MPARGLGAGIFETLMYQQQRQDQLDQEAQQMALRNAQMRLQEKQLEEEKLQNVTRNQFERERFDYTKSRDKAEDENKRWQDAFRWTNDRLGQGFTGAQIAPSADAVRAGDPFTFMKSVEGLPASPALTEKWEIAKKNIISRMELAEQKQFDTLYRALRTGGKTDEDAFAEAMAVIFGRRVNPNFVPPSPQAQQLAPVMGGDTMGVNPLLQQMGILAPSSGAETPNAGTPGFTGTVLPKVKAQMEASAAGVRSKNAYADKIAQDTAQKAMLFPIEMQAKLARIAESEARRANIKARTDRLLRFEVYDEMLKKAQVRQAVLKEDIDVLKKQQMQKSIEWRERMGYGSEAQQKAIEEAKSTNGKLFDKRKELAKELAVAKEFLVKMRVQSQIPDVPKDDKNYATYKYAREMAQKSIPDAEHRVRQIYSFFKEIDRMRNENAGLINWNITPTTTSGKPVNPPAISGTPKPGAKGLMTVTPPPGAKQQPRQNDYLRDKPKMQLRKPGGGNQTTRSGKVDYSKMSDAELKRALAKKLGGG